MVCFRRIVKTFELMFIFVLWLSYLRLYKTNECMYWTVQAGRARGERNTGSVTKHLQFVFFKERDFRSKRILDLRRVLHFSRFVKRVNMGIKKSIAAVIKRIDKKWLQKTRIVFVRMCTIYIVSFLLVFTFSLSVSRALVASSSNSIFGFRINARANATRCFWPLDNCIPFGPMFVS